MTLAPDYFTLTPDYAFWEDIASAMSDAKLLRALDAADNARREDGRHKFPSALHALRNEALHRRLIPANDSTNEKGRP